MERKKFVEILTNFGYKNDSVNKILQGKMFPTMRKAIVLKTEHGVPYEAWEDIPSFVRTVPKPSDDSIAQNAR